ncbi:hypothetical protein ACIOFV_45060 [Streptomyces mirabilis]|uniref:hypothetical protein n=1 Tax=Streptomyces mirabilis TaxID=68239 RepID=UPI0038085E51
MAVELHRRDAVDGLAFALLTDPVVTLSSGELAMVHPAFDPDSRNDSAILTVN